MTGIAQCTHPTPPSPLLTDPPGSQPAVHSTFLKRKGGLFKKAHELSVLCSVDVAVIIFGNNKKLFEYSSSEMRSILSRYTYVRFPFGSNHKSPY